MAQRPASNPQQRFDPDRRRHLQPDRLPDAGGALVPDTVRLGAPILLAAGLLGIVRIILGPDHNPMFGARSERIGDIEREGRLTAAVLADPHAINPDDRRVIDRAEAEPEPLPRRQPGRFEGTRVPEPGVKAGFVHPAQARFGRIRQGDPLAETLRVFVPPFGQAGIGIIEREVPDAGQIDPNPAGRTADSAPSRGTKRACGPPRGSGFFVPSSA